MGLGFEVQGEVWIIVPRPERHPPHHVKAKDM